MSSRGCGTSARSGTSLLSLATSKISAKIPTGLDYAGLFSVPAIGTLGRDKVLMAR